MMDVIGLMIETLEDCDHSTKAIKDGFQMTVGQEMIGPFLLFSR
ncbi:hypothetical protein PJO48_29895 [Mycobacterium kansasii]